MTRQAHPGSNNRSVGACAWLALLAMGIVLFSSVGGHAALVVETEDAEPAGERFLPPQIVGDANRDGRVDKADAAILGKYWGAIEATWEMGDFNGDGKVGTHDASILAANWGFISEASPIATPEPTTLLIWSLLGISGVAMTRWRRRK